MASGYAPSWRRFLQRHAPSLFKKCPQGNLHWRWDQWCVCGLNEHNGDWHGGIYDFRANREIPTYENMREHIDGHELCAHPEIAQQRHEAKVERVVQGNRALLRRIEEAGERGEAR